MAGEVSSKVGAVVPAATWAERNPEDLGYSESGIARAADYADRFGAGPVFVSAGGHCIAAWGDISRPSYVASVRKSALAMLFGRLHDDGKLDLTLTLDDLDIDDLVPLTPTEKTATVADLLQSRSGVYLEAASETPAMKARRPERGKYRPGEHFYYNNWDFNVLGAIFERAAGLDVFCALDEWLARPLGLQDFKADECQKFVEPSSRYGAYHLIMTARDMARLGLLVARGGRWGEAEVIGSEWIDRMTRPHTLAAGAHVYEDRPLLRFGYGYLWWIGEPAMLGGYRSFWGLGNGGHVLAVVPDLDLVMVHRGYRQAAYTSIFPLLGLLVDARIDSRRPTVLSSLGVESRQPWRVLPDSDTGRVRVTAVDGTVSIDAPAGWTLAPPDGSAAGQVIRVTHERVWVGRTFVVRRFEEPTERAAKADASMWRERQYVVDEPASTAIGAHQALIVVAHSPESPWNARRYFIDSNDGGCWLVSLITTTPDPDEVARDFQLLDELALTISW